jgi:hypothetical protein
MTVVKSLGRDPFPGAPMDEGTMPMKAIHLIPLIAMIVAGCASIEPHLTPTPAVFEDPRIDFESRFPEALRTTRQPVFYATTRARVADSDGHYGHADGGG